MLTVEFLQFWHSSCGFDIKNMEWTLNIRVLTRCLFLSKEWWNRFSVNRIMFLNLRSSFLFSCGTYAYTWQFLSYQNHFYIFPEDSLLLCGWCWFDFSYVVRKVLYLVNLTYFFLCTSVNHKTCVIFFSLLPSSLVSCHLGAAWNI